MPYDPRDPKDVPPHMADRPAEERRACVAAFNAAWERTKGQPEADRERAGMIACNVAAKAARGS